MGFSWEAALGAAAGFAIGGPAGAAVGYGMGNSISSADDARKAQESANEANINYATATNATSVELANTAHQREMRDLAAAGLNPILSAKYGGSSTPSLTAPKTESLAPVITSSAKQMNDSAALSLQAQQVQSTIAQQKTQATLNSAQAVKAGQEAQRVAFENDALAATSEQRKFEASHRNARPSWQKKLGLDVQDSVGTVVGPLKDLFRR